MEMNRDVLCKTELVEEQKETESERKKWEICRGRERERERERNGEKGQEVLRDVESFGYISHEKK